MSFLPAIPLPFTSPEGPGGIAVNANGTLLASAISWYHCVYVYSVNSTGKLTADPLAIGNGQLNEPINVCFARHDGTDTLLIADRGNNRVVEFTASGVFLRTIALRHKPNGIAYCAKSDVIAVSSFDGVVLLQYEELAIIGSDRLIGSGAAGITFTADGNWILVSDWGRHCISKFSAVDGAFVADVMMNMSFPICCTCEDGRLLVVESKYTLARPTTKLLDVLSDGAIPEESFLINAFGGVLKTESVCYSALLDGVVAKKWDGTVHLLRDAWVHSSRCAWLIATCIENIE